MHLEYGVARGSCALGCTRPHWCALACANAPRVVARLWAPCWVVVECRVKDTLHNALAASTVYVLFAWVVLFLSTEFIVNAFEASGQSAALIRLYTHYLVIGFAFNGMLFIANASFNNLQVPHYATLFNFARSFLGTMPLVFIFSRLYGPEGVMIGETLGAVLFGLLAYGVAIRVINRVANACSAAD